MIIEGRSLELPAQFATRRPQSLRLIWLGVTLSLTLLILTTLAAAQAVIWDDFNTHVWTVAIEESEDFKYVEKEWVQDGDRSVFRIRYIPGASTSNYILVFTNLLAPEPLDNVSEIRFEMKWDHRPSNAALKLEAKQLQQPFQRAEESLIFAQSVPLQSGGYREYRVPITTTKSFSRLLFVFDNVESASSEIYLDNLRLIQNNREVVWDSFDRRPRFWVPFGAWFSWAGPLENPALDMINTFGGFPDGPSGTLVLHWDSGPNGRQDIQTDSAEVKTEGLTVEAMERGDAPSGLNADFSAFTTISADVMITNANTIGIFFGHYADGTTTIEQAFITPGVRVEQPGEAQRLSWDIPWPPDFPTQDVDIVAFVVRDTHVPTMGRGTLHIDNVTLHPMELFVPDRDHAVWHISHFDFDARDERPAVADLSGIDPKMSFLSGNMGEFSPVTALTDQTVQVTHDPTQSGHADRTPGASLRLDLDLSQVDFAGEFISLFGHSDFKEAYTLDLTQFSQLQFHVRPGDDNDTPIWLRVEIKDYRDSLDYTAYRYVKIPATPSAWSQIVLDADITNSTQWRFNRFPPDPTRAKLLMFVMERFFNPERFSFYLDELRFIHKTDKPFDLNAALAQGEAHGVDALLGHVQQKAWLHFDRWVVDGIEANPDLYLFFDRSSYPDLISTAAVGFGLAAITVAHHRGWISEPEATSRVLRVLRTFANNPMIDDPTTASADDIDASIGVKGWFWHFLERDGTRKRKTYSGEPSEPYHKSELSSVDTAIFMWGALAARDYFSSTDPTINPHGPSSQAAEIADLVSRLYRRIDFPFFRRPEATPPRQGQIYLAWKPEHIEGSFALPALGRRDGRAGYFTGSPGSPATWDRYTDEILMILLLGVASPNEQYRLPTTVFPLQQYLLGHMTIDTYTAACEQEEVGPILHSFFGSSFTYFFLQNFMKVDHNLEPLLGIDLYQNAQRAARASWLYSRCGASTNAPTFHDNVFGLTAAEGRDRVYHGEWGALPRSAFGQTDDGTIPVYGHLGWLPLWPDENRDAERLRFRNPSVDALVTLFTEGRFFDDAHGFGDAINRAPEPTTGLPFYNMVTFGIDNGPILMGIENERSGLFWNLNLLCPELAAAGIHVDRIGLGPRTDATHCLTRVSAVRPTPMEQKMRP